MMQPAAGTDQQPWVAMQYPAAAMVMQHHMMGAAPPPPPPQFAPHFLPYPMPPPQAALASGSAEENKTIWVGDLQYWMEESYLHSCFGPTGEVINVKVIRNKQNGQSEGYGFVEFYSHAAAEKVLQSFSGLLMPNTDQPFRLNWASFSMGDRRKYSSVKAAKVVIDAITGRSKGYGFVRFGNDNEKTLAMTEMNGEYCSSRPMRIGAATPRKSSGGFGSNGASAQGFQSDGDSSNTTIFVGGLDPNVNEEELKQSFSKYGEVSSIKIPVGKQCGFVQFSHRNNAEEALQALNGTVIGKQTVRLSWGRNPANKQSRVDTSNHWNGVYYGGPVFDGYGYAVPPHDPSIYAAAYGAYPMYVNQQQVS